MTTADGGSDTNQLRVIASPPAKEDDRLDGFLNGNPGNTPNGWDFCERVPASIGPGNCSTCPPPGTGTTFLKYTAGITSSPSRPPLVDCQAYAYFTPPLAANQTRGLGFELLRIDGDPSDATLTIYSTTGGAETVETLGTWQLSNILPGPRSGRRRVRTSRRSYRPTPSGFALRGRRRTSGWPRRGSGRRVHHLRHRTASLLLVRGADVAAVQQILLDPNDRIRERGELTRRS
jgi:hypothetical protein